MEAKETYAVSIIKPKIAALIYDRVWSGLGRLNIPSHIAFDAFDEFAKDTEGLGVSTSGNGLEVYNNRTGDDVSNPGALGYIAASHLIRFEQAKAREKMYHPILDEDIRWRAELTFRSQLKAQYGIDATPVFESSEAQGRAYTQGNNRIIISILENISVIDDNQLEWEQVSEFREDKEARQMFLRLKHWLDKEMIGKSEQFIFDEISLRLENYEWAIKKHGLQTVTGVLSTVLDYRTLLTGIGTSVVVANFFDALLAAFSGGGIVMAGVGIKVANSLINLKDIKLGANSEVAFIHEIKRKLSE